jgi:hypothetical protein
MGEGMHDSERQEAGYGVLGSNNPTVRNGDWPILRQCVTTTQRLWAMAMVQESLFLLILTCASLKPSWPTRRDATLRKHGSRPFTHSIVRLVESDSRVLIRLHVLTSPLAGGTRSRMSSTARTRCIPCHGGSQICQTT